MALAYRSQADALKIQKGRKKAADRRATLAVLPVL
jgi:hypothetical protein